LERLEVRWGKVACWSTKAVETRKDRGKVTMEGLSPVPSQPSMASHSSRLGVRNPNPKLQSLLLQEQAQSYRLQIWPIHSQSPFEQKPIKNFGEKGAWAYPRTAQMFSVPPIISGMGKDINFKFCTHIHRIDQNKSPLKSSAKVSMGLLRDSRIFSARHP